MPPTALTYCPMSLRCLTLGSERGGVIAGGSGGGNPAPPRPLSGQGTGAQGAQCCTHLSAARCIPALAGDAACRLAIVVVGGQGAAPGEAALFPYDVHSHKH